MDSPRETVICSSCSSAVEYPANFCDMCGERLPPENPGQLGFRELGNPVFLSEENPGPKYVQGVLYHLRPDDIQVDSNRPLKFVDSEAIAHPADLMKDTDHVQPLLFRMDEEGNPVAVTGERRLQAARNAALESIPAVFIDDHYEEIKLAENILCEELGEISIIESALGTDLSEADFEEAVKKIRLESDYNHEQVRNLVGRTDSPHG